MLVIWLWNSVAGNQPFPKLLCLWSGNTYHVFCSHIVMFGQYFNSTGFCFQDISSQIFNIITISCMDSITTALVSVFKILYYHWFLNIITRAVFFGLMNYSLPPYQNSNPYTYFLMVTFPLAQPDRNPSLLVTVIDFLLPWERQSFHRLA